MCVEISATELVRFRVVERQSFAGDADRATTPADAKPSEPGADHNDGARFSQCLHLGVHFEAAMTA